MLGHHVWRGSIDFCNESKMTLRTGFVLRRDLNAWVKQSWPYDNVLVPGQEFMGCLNRGVSELQTCPKNIKFALDQEYVLRPSWRPRALGCVQTSKRLGGFQTAAPTASGWSGAGRRRGQGLLAACRYAL